MGKTVLISSHLLSEIELIANRMIIINKGRKVIEGNVADLLDPAHTLENIETSNNNQAKEKLKYSAWAPFLQKGDALQLMMNKESVPQLVNFLVSMEIDVYAVNSSHSLENYFLSLTTPSGYAESLANWVV